MLSKERRLDKVEIVGTAIQIRYRDCIIEDGVEIASTLFRETIGPLESSVGRPQLILDLVALIHTPAVIAEALANASGGI